MGTFLFALISGDDADARGGLGKRRNNGENRDNNKNDRKRNAQQNRNQQRDNNGNLHAEKKKKKKKKKKKPTQTTPTPAPCPSGQTRCGSACVDTAADLDNCGICGGACEAGEECNAGQCTCNSAKCTGCCDEGICRSGDNESHCGIGGIACNPCIGGQICQDGVCACPTGLTLCDGVCVNLKTNAAHCEQCGRACAEGNFCDGGFCRVPCGDRGSLSACLEGSSLPDCCNGVCKNILLDGSDCSACGHNCQDFGGNICIQGQCKCGFTGGVCANGLSCCPPVVDGSLGSCENLKSDRNHCGECHKPCPAGSTGCENGVCKCGAGVACTGNRPDCCAEECTNKRFSFAHCGACGAACPAGRANMCLEGVCKCGTGPVCDEFHTCCTGGNSGAGTCRDIDFDVRNCGACGNVCPGAGQSTVEVSCDRRVCLESRCIGLNFDLNNNWADGCEAADTASNHGESSQYLGATDCKDSRGGTFSGTIYSDKRKHVQTNPPTINPDTGSAALVYKVYGGRNPLCENDPYVKVTMTGGTSGCYSVTITTVERKQSAVIINGTAEVHMPSDSYPDGTDIYFAVEKTCSVPTNEVATFTAKYHL